MRGGPVLVLPPAEALQGASAAEEAYGGVGAAGAWQEVWPSVSPPAASIPSGGKEALELSNGVDQLQLESQQLAQKRGELESSLENARLLEENLRLRTLNEDLLQESGELRQALNNSARALDRFAELRREDSLLRKDHEALQLRLSSLAAASETQGKDDLAASATVESRNFTAVRSAVSNLHISRRLWWLGGASAVLVVSLGCCWCCGCLYLFDTMPDYDEEDDFITRRPPNREERTLEELTYPYSCLCFFCNRGLVACICVVLVVTAVGAALMWEAGLLKPALAEFSMYTYVVLVLAIFVFILVLEVWVAVGRYVRYVMREFRRLKGVFQRLHPSHWRSERS